MATIKVRVILSLEVDTEAWDTIYGTGTDAGVVREDVKTYVGQRVQGSAAHDEGGIVTVAVA